MRQGLTLAYIPTMGDAFDGVRRLCETAVGEEVVPGLVLLCASGGRTVFHEAFGWRQVTPRRLRARPDTVYGRVALRLREYAMLRRPPAEGGSHRGRPKDR